MPSDLRILSLDSSGSELSAALLTVREGSNSEIIAVTRTGTQSHDEGMADAIQELLSKASSAGASVTGQEITAVVAGSGPGSFTGLRISLAFSKGLSFALGMPLILLPSALGAAAGFFMRGAAIPERVNVLAVAGRDQFFLSEIERARPFELVGASVVLSKAEITARMEALGVSVQTKGAESPRRMALEQSGISQGPLLVCLDPSIREEFGALFFESSANIAQGLLEVLSQRARHSNWAALLGEYAFSVERIAALEPNYVRAVAAKTIAERTLLST